MRKNFANYVNDFKDYARTFCQLCAPFSVLYYTAEYRIDKIAYRHLQKLRTFCIAWPDRLH